VCDVRKALLDESLRVEERCLPRSLKEELLVEAVVTDGGTVREEPGEGVEIGGLGVLEEGHVCCAATEFREELELKWDQELEKAKYTGDGRERTVGVDWTSTGRREEESMNAHEEAQRGRTVWRVDETSPELSTDDHC
jgi:hypothetical protein